MVGVQKKQRKMVAAINPAEWLQKQKSPCRLVGGTPMALTMGLEALEEAGGDVMVAMTENPSLQAEIVMAYLFSDKKIGESARGNILCLALAMDNLCAN